MRRIGRLAAAAAVATLASVAGATTAHAEVQASDDTLDQVTSSIEVSAELEAYLETLTPAERADFVETHVPVETDVEVGAQVPADATARASLAEARAAGQAVEPMATGCWTQRWTWAPKAAAGNTLYTYYHVGYWCSSGSTVTAASVADAGGETKTIGWRYEGIVRDGAGVVSNQGRSYTQHKFVLGVGGWDIQTPLECARVKGLSTATSTADSVCGIY